MGTTANIVTGLKTLIVAELGGTYQELAYGLDVSKNRFNGGALGYAVLPAAIDPVDGVTGYATVDQEFQIVLTETFGQSRTGDQAQLAIAQTLFGRMESLYTRVAREKAGVPSSVMRVAGLTVDPIEFLDANVAVLRATVTIRYRTAL